MNAQDIWVGHDYALFPNRGRGEAYRPSTRNVHRVKAMRVFKRKNSYYAERLTTYVEVHMLNHDGTPRLDSNGNEVTREVPAREIVGDWNEYWNEDQVRRAEQIEREKEKERLDDLRKQEDELIRARLDMRGLPREAVKISPYHESITISREGMKKWLRIS